MRILGALVHVLEIKMSIALICSALQYAFSGFVHILVLFGDLLRLNFYLVSFFFKLLGHFIEGLQNVACTCYATVNDAIDQYGELCTGVVQGVSWSFDSASQVGWFILSLLWLAVQRFCNWLSTAFCIIAKIGPLIVFICKCFTNCTYFLLTAVMLAMDGLAMFFQSVFQAADLLIRGSIRYVVHLSVSTVQGLRNTGLYIISQPSRFVSAVKRILFSIPLESYYGVLLCMTLYLLWKYGIFQVLLRQCIHFIRWPLRAMRRMLVSSLESLLGFVVLIVKELACWFVPWVPLVAHVVQWLFRYFAWFAGALFPHLPTYIATLRRRITARAVVENHSDPVAQPTRRRSSSTIFESADDRLSCVVCQDAERSVLAMPCRHLCMCRTCADELCRRWTRQCPICRQTISSVTNVYL